MRLTQEPVSCDTAQAPNKPAVATYSFNGMDLRVVEIAGEPWFVAVDVCRAIGAYVRQNGEVQTANALRPLSSDEVRVPPNPISGSRGPRSAKVISESGLYKLVMRSDKKEAKQFQEWVTREVLPSIRKTGTYTMPGAENVPPYT